jgi:pSer/pThr/pTyr-binding forkhead associated (FHA) protein
VLDRVVEAEPAGGELRLGRRAGVDLALPFPTVSAFHARVFRSGGGWAVADLGSANGSTIAGVRLSRGTPYPLRPGDTVRLADVALTFEGEVGATAPPGPGGAVESTTTLARRLVNDLFQAVAGDVARVLVVGGPATGRSLPLVVPDRVYRVGRAPECDLVLPDDDVSREHAAFERRWQGVFVRDLGSKNGVEIDGSRVTGERRLRDGESARLGASELRVDDPEERYLREMEAADEAAALPDAPLAAAGAEAPPPAAPQAAASPDDQTPARQPGERPRRPRPPGSSVPLAVTALALLAIAGVVYFVITFLVGGTPG